MNRPMEPSKEKYSVIRLKSSSNLNMSTLLVKCSLYQKVLKEMNFWQPAEKVFIFGM